MYEIRWVDCNWKKLISSLKNSHKIPTYPKSIAKFNQNEDNTNRSAPCTLPVKKPPNYLCIDTENKPENEPHNQRTSFKKRSKRNSHAANVERKRIPSMYLLLATRGDEGVRLEPVDDSWTTRCALNYQSFNY